MHTRLQLCEYVCMCGCCYPRTPPSQPQLPVLSPLPASPASLHITVCTQGNLTADTRCSDLHGLREVGCELQNPPPSPTSEPHTGLPGSSQNVQLCALTCGHVCYFRPRAVSSPAPAALAPHVPCTCPVLRQRWAARGMASVPCRQALPTAVPLPSLCPANPPF